MSERANQLLTQQDINSILGNLDDASTAAILEIGPSVKELEEAMAWASGESDVMGELERPLEGAVARVYDILTQDEAWLEDRS